MSNTLEQGLRWFSCPVLTSPFRFEPQLSLPGGAIRFIDLSSFPIPASEHLRLSCLLNVFLLKVLWKTAHLNQHVLCVSAVVVHLLAWPAVAA